MEDFDYSDGSHINGTVLNDSHESKHLIYITNKNKFPASKFKFRFHFALLLICYVSI